MTPQLGYAILGLLARRKQTGYGLARRMRRPIGYFWSASHSQIYPELSRLEGAGLVRHHVIKGRGPLPTKEYEITDAGLRALAEWIGTDPEPIKERDTNLLRVYSSWVLDAGDRVDLVRAIQANAVDRFRAYEMEEATFDAEKIAQPATAEFAAYATLRRGLLSARAELEWCDWLLDALKSDEG